MGEPKTPASDPERDPVLLRAEDDLFQRVISACIKRYADPKRWALIDATGCSDFDTALAWIRDARSRLVPPPSSPKVCPAAPNSPDRL